MAVGQVTMLWQGFTGSPGYTTFNFGPGEPDPVDGDAMITAVDGFAASLSTMLGTGGSLTVQPEVNWYNEATGELIDVTAVSPAPGAHVSAAGGPWGPIPTGAVISWKTAGINRAHKVYGRTYCVPLSAAAYQSDGTLTAAVVSGITGFAATLAGDADATLGVWSRPVAGVGGAWFPVTTWRVPDMAAVLRSRRD